MLVVGVVHDHRLHAPAVDRRRVLEDIALFQWA
jgi:hypothetical protein